MEKHCLYHPEKIGKAFCKRCNGYVCEECIIEINGKRHCKKCYQEYQKMQRQKQQQLVKINNDEPYESANETEYPSYYSQPTHFPNKRKYPFLKNVFAIIIGILGALFVRFIIATIIMIISKSEIPPDITILLDIFVSFLAGSLASGLVPSKGWLIGFLTQILQLFVLVAVIILKIFEISDFSIPSWHIRLAIFCITSATIAGYVTEKYRDNLWSFIKSVFSFVTGSIFLLFEILSFIIYIFPFYLAGKLLFEQGAVLKALLVAFVAGPIASAIVGGIFMGIVYGFGWILSIIYNWYADDLGYERL